MAGEREGCLVLLHRSSKKISHLLDKDGRIELASVFPNRGRNKAILKLLEAFNTLISDSAVCSAK